MIYNSLYGTFENVFGKRPKLFEEANNLMPADKVYKYFQNICEIARSSDCKETLPSFYLKSDYTDVSVELLYISGEEPQRRIDMNIVLDKVNNLDKFFKMCRLFNSFIIPRNVKRYSEFPARYKYVSEIQTGEDIVKISERLGKEVNENFRSFYYLPEVSRIVKYSNYLYRKELRRGTDLSDYQEESTEDLVEDYFINYLEQFSSDELDIIAQEVNKTFLTEEYKDFLEGEVIKHFDKARRYHRLYEDLEESRKIMLGKLEEELKDFCRNLRW